MKLHELNKENFSRKKRKRKGRGPGSGNGKTAGRGMNGQNSRSGGGVRPGFEGGQLPLFKRIPKRGFNNINRKEYNILNLRDLEKLNFSKIDFNSLKENKIIKRDLPIKILGNGKLTKKINLECHKISKSAQEMIEKQGGSVKLI